MYYLAAIRAPRLKYSNGCYCNLFCLPGSHYVEPKGVTELAKGIGETIEADRRPQKMRLFNMG